MKTRSVDDQTYKRLASILSDMMHAKKRDINHDDVINELGNVDQDGLSLSGGNAGG